MFIKLPGNTDEMSPMPRLLMDVDTWAVLTEYVAQAQTEINGFAYVNLIDPRTFVIDSPNSLFITEQEVSMGSADVDAHTFARAVQAASDQDRSAELKMQWHSHVNGAAYFSGTDTNTIDSYGDAGISWMLSMVLNKRGEFSLRLDQFYPIRSATSVALFLVNDMPDGVIERVRDDINRLVRVKPLPKKATVRNKQIHAVAFHG